VCVCVAVLLVAVNHKHSDSAALVDSNVSQDFSSEVLEYNTTFVSLSVVTKCVQWGTCMEVI
jgi:hypothetical protein